MLFLNTNIEETNAQQLSRLIELLPLQRREVALRINNARSRRESVLAYMELCRGLREEYAIHRMPQFLISPTGKPYLEAHPHIHFSLSHCREAVGCLLSDMPCGLDIERVRPLNPALVRHTMNAEESRMIFSAENPAVAFIRLWTQKEAVLKLTGEGIRDNLHEALSPENLRGIRLHTEEHPGFVLSTATLDIAP